MQTLKARLHWRFYLDENVSVLATVSMFVVMDVYDSHGKQIHQPWDTLGRRGLKNRKSSIFSKRYAQGTIITLIILRQKKHRNLWRNHRTFSPSKNANVN